MTMIVYELVGADAARPFSPHCWKAVMALAHKGLDFERRGMRFVEVAQIEGGVSKTVPVLRDGTTLVSDSFAIAEYLDEAYPDRPSLFGGEGGRAMARFVERWTQLTLHPYLGKAALMDIHDAQDAENRRYFRASREKRYGIPLEAAATIRDAGLGEFRAALEPVRSTLTFQRFIGGSRPLFADYIVFAALQWVRVISPFAYLAPDDPVAAWFERCLDLHDGVGRAVPAAA
ncbi:MAG: glutathione S-transferase family protein [Rhizobiaceae bacterium]